jgi:hypothetical protein
MQKMFRILAIAIALSAPLMPIDAIARDNGSDKDKVSDSDKANVKDKASKKAPKKSTTSKAKLPKGRTLSKNAKLPKFWTLEGVCGPNLKSADVSKISDAAKKTPQLRYLIQASKLWPVGGTITVAFYGGAPNFQQEVVDAASEWSRYGNINFDFGFDPKAGQYRQWSPDDIEPAADIRLTFEGGGYSSMVGTDTLSIPANEPTMYMGESDRENFPMWRRHIIHEFGHALGFQHEHINPSETCDFKWEDDPGYVETTNQNGWFVPDSQGRVPSLYRYYLRSQGWDKATVDNNLRLNFNGDLSEFILSPSDRKSIMHYAIPAVCLRLGESSPCNIKVATEMSEGDRAGIAKAYPFDARGLTSPNDERKKGLQSLIDNPDLPDGFKAKLKTQMKAFEKPIATKSQK